MEKKCFEDANRCDLESGHVVFLRAQRRTVHWRTFFCFGCADGDGDGDGGNGDSDLLCDLLGGVRWYLGFADASPSLNRLN